MEMGSEDHYESKATNWADRELSSSLNLPTKFTRFGKTQTLGRKCNISLANILIGNLHGHQGLSRTC